MNHQIDRMKMKNAVKEKKEDEEDTMMSMFGDFSRSQVEDVAVPLETHCTMIVTCIRLSIS